MHNYTLLSNENVLIFIQYINNKNLPGTAAFKTGISETKCLFLNWLPLKEVSDFLSELLSESQENLITFTKMEWSVYTWFVTESLPLKIINPSFFDKDFSTDILKNSP